MTETVPRANTAAPHWVACPGCGHLLYSQRLARTLGVCSACGRHLAVPAPQRLAQLLDEGSLTPIEAGEIWLDPLGFVDSQPYPRRLAAATERTGLPEAVVCGQGTVDGHPVVAAVMDFRFLGGSLGAGVGERITRAAETALRARIPLLLVTASGGARMQEGAIALMQMAKTSQALRDLDQAGILTISLITDPTFGGVAASFATLCDIIVAEPGARLGFAGPRVIEQTIRQQLPPGLQTAEFLLERGFIDLIRPRAGLRATLARLLSLGSRHRSGPGLAEPGPQVSGSQVSGSQGSGSQPAGAACMVTDPDLLPSRDPWTAVRTARDLRRPTTAEYLGYLLDDFGELRGDRVSGDCAAIIGGTGRLGSQPVIAIGHQKGHDAPELISHGYGMPKPAGYRKAARLMRLAAKLGLPLLTLIDTPGAYPGIEAEEGGQALAIAQSLHLMGGLPVPTIAVVTGEGGSGGALALAVADQVLMCENATYSVISPEGCAAILWKDPAAAPLAANALRLSSRELLALGVVDRVVREPAGGAGADPAEATRLLAAAVTATLRELTALDPLERMSARRRRFRRFGLPPEEDPRCQP